MSDYPNPEEEFELMYGDELLILQEQEEEEFQINSAGPPSRKSLDFSTPKNKAKRQTNSPQPCSSKQADILENSFDRDFQRLNESDPNLKKRRIDELFGDIDDLIVEEQYYHTKKKKTDVEKSKDDLALIDRILQMRQISAGKQNPDLSVGRIAKPLSYEEHIKNNLSYRVPKYPFIGVTGHDGERIYVRMHCEEYEKEDIQRIISDRSYKELFSNQSKDLWKKANEIINLQIDSKSTNLDGQMEVEEINNSKLWVDLYKPRKYTELLSDESTNRTLLKWIKLWDKVVFHRRPRIKQIKTQFPNSKFQKHELDVNLDQNGCPRNKVALLCGPPGLGKTTLTHMVARHAGYNVVEINASDDRNVESFRTALKNATEMKSVIDKEGRPNCLVFDEIDGAPSASIDLLIKFINGTAAKTKKGQKQKPTILKRPIICICNDVYVPALRPLRQIAFVLNFPPTKSSRLAERLIEITKYQRIKTDLGAMLALSEKTNNDIRSCLTVLSFFKTKAKPVTLTEIDKANIGQKDMQKGLFAVWNDIFQIKLSKSNNSDTSLSDRMKYVLDSVVAFGDYDRLIQGIFENYSHQETALPSVCSALDWFSFTDCLNKKIQETQNYTMMSYLPFGFVVWHYVFASYGKKNLTYPTFTYEVTTKQKKQTAIVSEILRGMSPSLRSYSSSDSLRLDTIPLITNILTPNLRTVNVSLYNLDEKSEVNSLVDVMIDYNLTYVQERTLEGTYVFHIDPNIEEINTFGGVTTDRNNLSNMNKQMLAREIELEKLRRMEKSRNGPRKEDKDGEQERKNGEEKQNERSGKKLGKENQDVNKVVPNHLQRLKAKSVAPKVIVSDFFGRIITKPEKPKFGDLDKQSSGDIWYQFKEGYSNAVRRNIEMDILLQD